MRLATSRGQLFLNFLSLLFYPALSMVVSMLRPTERDSWAPVTQFIPFRNTRQVLLYKCCAAFRELFASDSVILSDTTVTTKTAQWLPPLGFRGFRQ